jgi:hypothetical protein
MSKANYLVKYNYKVQILCWLAGTLTSLLIWVPQSTGQEQQSISDELTPEQEQTHKKISELFQNYQRRYSVTNQRSKPATRRSISLYIRGQDGVDFPDPADLRRKHQEFINRAKQDLSPAIAHSFATAKPTKGPRLLPVRTCAVSKTEQKRLSRPKRKIAKKKTFQGVQYDVLMVQRQFLPQDYMKAFGKRVTVKVYDRDEKSFFTTALKYSSTHIPCLPYRVRITDQSQYIHFGKDALLNYDQGVEGKGKLTSEVQNLITLEGW